MAEEKAIPDETIYEFLIKGIERYGQTMAGISRMTSHRDSGTIRKEELYKELKLKLTLAIEGVQYDVGIFDKLLDQQSTLRKSEINTLDKDLISRKVYNIPYAYRLPYGFCVGMVADKNSPYKIVEEKGLEYFSSIGVVTVASSWIPAVGSPLEGHRSPSADWHWDTQLRHADLLKKYGRTYQEIFDATPARNYSHEIFQIENEELPVFKNAKVVV
jgi:hypothetical protein